MTELGTVGFRRVLPFRYLLIYGIIIQRIAPMSTHGAVRSAARDNLSRRIAFQDVLHDQHS